MGNYIELLIGGDKYNLLGADLDKFRMEYGISMNGINEENFVIWARDNEIRFIKDIHLTKEVRINEYLMDYKESWCVYLLKCADNSIYVGYTNNIYEKLIEHDIGKISSTEGRLPISIERLWYTEDRSEASEMKNKINSYSIEEQHKLINEVKPH